MQFAITVKKTPFFIVDNLKNGQLLYKDGLGTFFW